MKQYHSKHQAKFYNTTILVNCLLDHRSVQKYVEVC